MSNSEVKKLSAHAEISRSRSFINPFKVGIIGEDGDKLGFKLLPTKLKCKNNLLSIMKAFGGQSIVVDCVANGTKYKLWSDGFEQLIND